MPAVKRCRSCDRPIGSDARFCGSCGARSALDDSATIRTRDLHSNTPSSTRNSPRTASLHVQSGAQPAAGDSNPRWTFWTILSLAANPGRIVSDAVRSMPWPVSLTVSGSAFSLLFLQTRLDLDRVGRATSGGLLMMLTGALLGTIGLAIVAAAAWGLSRLVGGTPGIGATVKTFGLCYSPALVSGVSGVACNLLLGWNTTLAFGVTGFLWALGPQVAAFRELSGGRLGMAVLMASVCGGLLLFLWYAAAAA